MRGGSDEPILGRSAGFGPHIGIAYSPRRSGRTVIRAGAGTVYGHVPLLAADFVDNPRARWTSLTRPEK